MSIIKPIAIAWGLYERWYLQDDPDVKWFTSIPFITALNAFDLTGVADDNLLSDFFYRNEWAIGDAINIYKDNNYTSFFFSK